MTTTTAISTTLTDAIRTELAAAKAAAASAVEHACKAGQLLIQAKESCPHGEWGEWLRENVDVSERTARSYMQLARQWQMLPESKRRRVADLPLRGALAEIAERLRPRRALRRRAKTTKKPELVIDLSDAEPGAIASTIENAAAAREDEARPTRRPRRRAWAPDPDRIFRKIAECLLGIAPTCEMEVFDLEKVSPELLAEYTPIITDALNVLRRFERRARERM